MTGRWEYMTIVWSYSTAREDGETVWKQGYTIFKPGQEPEDRESWSSAGPESHKQRVPLHELLSELGAEGWELVTETVLDSVILEKRGWSKVGTPVGVRWTMKRAVPAA